MDYIENSPSYRVWNPLKAKKVANVGGAEFDESVGKAWWRGGLGVKDLADMELVIFSGCKGGWECPSRWGGWGDTPIRPGWRPIAWKRWVTRSRPTGGWDGELGGS